MPHLNPYKSDIGYSASRKNSLTNDYNILYDGKVKTDIGTKNGRWILACAKHESTIIYKNKQQATTALATPENWCHSCKNIFKMEEAELILTLKTNRNTNDQLQRLACFAISDPEKRLLFEELTGHIPEDYIKELK
jgi:hypothetical protein